MAKIISIVAIAVSGAVGALVGIGTLPPAWHQGLLEALSALTILTSVFGKQLAGGVKAPDQK